MCMSLNQIKLKNFTQLNKDEIKLVWEFRNDERVAKFMKTPFFSFEAHLEFIKNLSKDITKRYFVVFENEKIIGVIDYVKIEDDSCEFGLYQNPNLRGYGQILMQTLLDYAFEVLKMKQISAYVMNFNEKAKALYLKNGFEVVKKDETMTYFRLGGGGI